ncbi:IS200/IS605 family transposase [Moorena producens PAL-8-15-08-1]|uniref:IS200/IS605 family transposase n=1 Tax=Moorena producens PAL-8-15-08-1 TaxID=1458985 RepID=A0A1D8TZ01_9CYAN|nr:IS200/IS605 family transposase [Moorena producens]AOX02868.1 IS200/IS605 family transposase [Moorena producens PAL-8-15-08-1]
MKKKFATKGRSVSDLKAHLVLTTKYRRKVFTDGMLQELHDIFADLLEKWDGDLVEFNGESDHVHLLFQYHPDIQLSNLVNNLKSVSSRKLRQQFNDVLSRFYSKNVVWNSSYFVASSGGVTITQLKKYIENQERPKE